MKDAVWILNFKAQFLDHATNALFWNNITFCIVDLINYTWNASKFSHKPVFHNDRYLCGHHMSLTNIEIRFIANPIDGEFIQKGLFYCPSKTNSAQLTAWLIQFYVTTITLMSLYSRRNPKIYSFNEVIWLSIPMNSVLMNNKIKIIKIITKIPGSCGIRFLLFWNAYVCILGFQFWFLQTSMSFNQKSIHHVHENTLLSKSHGSHSKKCGIWIWIECISYQGCSLFHPKFSSCSFWATVGTMNSRSVFRSKLLDRKND